MKVLTGRVVNGKIDVDAELQEDDEGYQLTPEEEEEIYASLEEIRRGNHVDGRDLVRELKDKRS